MPLSSKWLIAQATRRAQGRNAHSFSLLTSPMTPFARSSCRSRRRLTKRITGKIVSFTVRPRAPTTAAERPSPTDSRAAETKPLPRRLRLKRQLAATMSALLAPRSRKIAAARRRRRPASLKRRPKRGSSKALQRLRRSRGSRRRRGGRGRGRRLRRGGRRGEGADLADVQLEGAVAEVLKLRHAGVDDELGAGEADLEYRRGVGNARRSWDGDGPTHESESRERHIHNLGSPHWRNVLRLVDDLAAALLHAHRQLPDAARGIGVGRERARDVKAVETRQVQRFVEGPRPLPAKAPALGAYEPTPGGEGCSTVRGARDDECGLAHATHDDVVDALKLGDGALRVCPEVVDRRAPRRNSGGGDGARTGGAVRTRDASHGPRTAQPRTRSRHRRGDERQRCARIGSADQNADVHDEEEGRDANDTDGHWTQRPRRRRRRRRQRQRRLAAAAPRHSHLGSRAASRRLRSHDGASARRYSGPSRHDSPPWDGWQRGACDLQRAPLRFNGNPSSVCSRVLPGCCAEFLGLRHPQ
mmetsp:Transcript_79261/g.256937  ORF Transcript_79261/g.256937 Transcript_79261/m.256937 type:complete len:529 (+) Transcript_79261:87-1673(+)